MEFVGTTSFDTNLIFSGGGGLFVQYHDIVKNVYLMAVIKLILQPHKTNLPVNIISKMSPLTLTEWYVRRRYVNPLKCLDYDNKYSIEELDVVLQSILKEDSSLYRLAPVLNIRRLLASYSSQHMTFPLFVYTEYEEGDIKSDCNSLFPGIPINYLYGDLKTALSKCDQNYTYMFSDIELFSQAVQILAGTYSHILLASDYRYNYKSRSHSLKYNLSEMANKDPFLRLETNIVANMAEIAGSISNTLNIK